MRHAPRFSLLLLGCAALLLAGLPTPATALPPWAPPEWQSLQVTHNWTQNERPVLSADRLVWQAFDGVDWEILTYDLASGSIEQLTDDTADETGPEFVGEHLVWVSDPAPLPPWVFAASVAVPSLTLYDPATGALETIPQSDRVLGPPVTSGDLVVFLAGPSPDDADLYVYSLASGQTRCLTRDSYPQSDPATDGRYVAFVTHPYQYSELWLFDSETGKMMQLSSVGRASNTVGPPSANAGRIVWVESDGRDYFLRLFDTAVPLLTTLTRTEDHTLAQPLRTPVLGGDTLAWLVWTDPGRPRFPHDSPWTLMVSNLSAFAPRAVGAAFGGELWMQEDGTLLAYTDFDLGPRLHAYDLATGTDQVLEAGAEGDSGGGTTLPMRGARGLGTPPSLNEGRVAAAAYQFVNPVYDDSDIVLAYRGSAPATPLSPSPPVRRFSDVGDSAYAQAIADLAARGIVRGYRAYDHLEFAPSEASLRWQFLRMVLEATGVRYDFTYNAQPGFVDLIGPGGEDMFLRRVVEAGFELGITRGTTARTFGPYAPISRAEATSMLVRAAEVASSGSTATPTDYQGTLVGFSGPHAENLRTAEYQGFFRGLVGFGSAWDPLAPLTRGEAAQVLVNLMHREVR
ncbi:MAG: S-layer homology domain-containing protein [Thermoleophilia bacterium]